MADLKELQESVLNGNRKKSEELTRKALDEGASPVEIINEGLIPGMQVVGEKFKCNEFYVPEVLVAARAMQSAMALVKPLLAAGDIKARAKVAIGTVQGDLHDIGKNLVMMMLEGAGFEIVDCGVDVSPEKFLEAVKDKGASVIAMSALLTTTMPGMKTTIQALDEAGLRDKITVLVGGAPVTQEYADEIGADGYAPDAASAVDALKEILNV
ncbi:MAG: corrinoid protein [Armatimonadetes bacterium]|nr:corrinoid protein [Armatimonadota bacterium]